MIARIRTVLPVGRTLPQEVWGPRHRGITWMLWFHAVGLTIFAVVRGNSWRHAVFEGLLVSACAVAAGLPLSRRARAVAAAAGMLASSAILVHLSGGMIEAHFHYFVMLGLVILYQDWLPFLMFILFVAGQHSIMGILDPGSVFNHPAAVQNPVVWGAIHGMFVLAASIASLVIWRGNEVLREQAERHLRDRVEAERALTRAKSELVQTASHELRTPLTVILGFARTLDHSWEQFTDAERREQLGLIKQRAGQLSGLIDTFLTVEKLEAGDVPAAEDVPVAEVVTQVVRDLGLSGVQRMIDGDPLAQGNPAYLYQILANYLTNAQKYGAPPYSVEAREQGTWVEVIVRDEGEGIPEGAAARLFERFQQEGSSAPNSGFGLGLSIVDRLASVHGGEVWYEPNHPHGAMFGVRLPRSPGGTSPYEGDTAGHPAGRGEQVTVRARDAADRG